MQPRCRIPRWPRWSKSSVPETLGQAVMFPCNAVPADASALADTELVSLRPPSPSTGLLDTDLRRWPASCWVLGVKRLQAGVQDIAALSLQSPPSASSPMFPGAVRRRSDPTSVSRWCANRCWRRVWHDLKPRVRHAGPNWRGTVEVDGEVVQIPDVAVGGVIRPPAECVTGPTVQLI